MHSINLFFISFIKTFLITLFVFKLSLKFSNNLYAHKKVFLISNVIFSLINAFLLVFFSCTLTVPLIIIFSFFFFLIIDNFKLLHSFIISFISLCLNFGIYLFSVVLYYIFSTLINLDTSNYSLIIIFVLYALLINLFLKSHKLKYGITYLNKHSENNNVDLIFINFSIITLLLFILLPQINYYLTVNFILLLLSYFVLMSISLYKSFSLYYKHNLLVKELNDTKLELEKKDKEIERLEKENLEFSKTSHSIAHKQRVLEYKLNQLQLNTEFTNELDLSDKLKEISDTYSSNVTNLTLPKTGIENIDDILEYMQSECTKNNINFELQLNGDIFSMVTTVINKEKLEILLADHIKNAIIAINSSENINKSILVRLGLINDIYSIYFYDSGIEFDENVLSSLGKEQITTHKDIGGTGCGFLNTFDTLKEFNASLEINEISAPCKDNYTKSIVIKFDGKNDFTINSYKKQE